MKSTIQPVDRYSCKWYRLSDLEWQKIKQTTNAPISIDPIREEVWQALYLYSHADDMKYGFEFLSRDEIASAEIKHHDASDWFRCDLQKGYDRLSKAARQMRAAYEYCLHPGWPNRAAEREDWECCHDVDRMRNELAIIEKHSTARAAEIAKRKRELKKDFAAPLQPPGPRAKAKLALRLINHWDRAGGPVGQSNPSRDTKRPNALGRFLQATMGLVLDGPPAIGTMNDWIRLYRYGKRSKDPNKKRPPSRAPTKGAK